MKCLKIFALAAMACALFAADQAAANLLANPGFEGPPIASGPAPFTGRWEPFGGSGPVLPSLAATDSTMPLSGVNDLVLQLDNVANSFAGVFQDVGGLIAGNNVTWSGWAKDLGADAGGTEIRIEFRNSGTDTEVSRTGNLVPALTDQYTQWSLTAPIPVGADLARVVYAIQSFGAGPNQLIYVDDTSVIPEPATVMLLGLAGLALVGIRRRRS